MQVYLLPVNFVGIERARAQVRDRPDAVVCAARLTPPQRQRRAPVTLARQGPVHIVFQPVAKAAALDVRRIPVDLFVGAQEPVLHGCGANVPRRLGIVE